MLVTVAIAAIVLVAAFLQGLTGFGFGLIALPLLGFFLDIKTIIPLMLLLAVIISLSLSWQLRRSINMKAALTLFVFTLPGIPLGVYVLKVVTTQTLAIGLGVLMILFTSYQLTFKPKPRKLGWFITALAGFSSGVLGGSIGAGGPPVIVYSTIQPWSKDQAKATLTFYFAISALLIIVSHAIAGLITPQVLRLYSITFLPLLAGIWLGVQAYKHISDHGYRKLAFVLVFVLGCMMIYRNV